MKRDMFPVEAVRDSRTQLYRGICRRYDPETQPRGCDSFEVQWVLEETKHIADLTGDELLPVQDMHGHKVFR